MKAILEFDLNEPDDVISHLRCIKSLDMALALFEIVKNLHRKLPDSEITDQFLVAICEELEERGVDIDELLQ